MYLTIHNIDTVAPEKLFYEFLEAIKGLIEMDESDYADREDAHLEWTAQACWARMKEEDKATVRVYIPDMEYRMSWGSMSESVQDAFYVLYTAIYT